MTIILPHPASSPPSYQSYLAAIDVMIVADFITMPVVAFTTINDSTAGATEVGTVVADLRLQDCCSDDTQSFTFACDRCH